MSDALVLVCGALLIYVPGLLLLVALRVRSLRVAVGTAPVVTIALLQLVALLRWGLGTGLARTIVGVVAAVAVVAVVLEVRAGRDGVLVAAGRTIRTAVQRGPATTALSVVLLVGGVVIGMSEWLRGMAGLATPPQEHDTVTHTLVAAWIAFTGRAGPFEVEPTDLVTGSPVHYYPAGAHMLAGVLGMWSGDVVSAFNAMIVLVLGLAAPVTLFCAVAAFEPLRTRPVFSGLAALVAVTAYRPFFQFAHDAGVMTFAMGVALVPAFAVALTGLGPRLRQAPSGVAVTALVAMGLYTVHPSLAVVVVVVMAVSGAVALLSSVEFRRWLRQRLPQLVVVAAAAALLSLPWALASLPAAGAVASYGEQPPGLSLGRALEVVAGFRYGGFVTQAASSQTALAVLFWLGFVGCLTRRRLWPVAAAWLFWAVVMVLWTSGHSGLPVLAQLGGVFYNSTSRMTGIEWLLAPAVAGLGLSALVSRVLEAAPALRPRRVALLVPAAAVVTAVAYFASAGWHYVDVNAASVGDRWGKPQFYRIAPAERQAFDYLAAHRAEVGRVLNNGNDGSTFAYVYDGIPIINIYPEGDMQAAYGVYLMQHLNEIGINPAVRCLVQRYHVTHVLMSRTSPPLLGRGFPDNWVRTKWFQYPTGFSDLGAVPQVSLVFANSDSLVFRIADSVLQGDDSAACTRDPSRPIPGETTASALADPLG